jgi:hypothetical protein
MGKFGLYTGVVNGDEFVKIPYLFQFQKLVIYKFIKTVHTLENSLKNLVLVG